MMQTGCNQVYTVRVDNTGDATASSITIWDSLPSGMKFVSVTGPSCVFDGTKVVCSMGSSTLGAGVDVEVKITTTATTTGLKANFAQADYRDPSLNWYRSTGNTSYVTVMDPALQLGVTTASTVYSSGQTLIYTLTYATLGAYQGKNVRIWDTIPAGAQYVSSSVNSGTSYVSGGMFVWTMPVGPNSASGNLTVVVPDLCGTLYSNSFCMQAENDCGTALPLAITKGDVTVQNARIDLVKSADKTVVLQGDTLVYTLAGQNNCEDDAKSVVMLDTLPAGTVFLRATGTYVFDGTKITWAPVTVVRNFAKYGDVILQTFTVSVTGLGPVIGPNTARLSYLNKADLPQSGASNPLSVTVSNPDLKLYVTSPVSAISGEPVTFNITLRNEGTATAYGVVLVDTLPSPLYLVSATGPYTGDMALVSWAFGDMLALEERSVSLTARGVREEVDRMVVNMAQGLCRNDFGLSVPGAAAANSVALVVILREPKVYPSPYNPAKAVRGTMKFSELPPGSTVTILTLSGVKVRHLDGVVANRLEWDGRNEDGTLVGPGMYFYSIEIPGGEEGKRVVKGRFGLSR